MIDQKKFRVALVKFAMEFSTKEELQMYLKEHPNADRSKHRVKTGPDTRDKKKKSEVEDQIIDLHEFSDLDPENVEMEDVDRAVKALGAIIGTSKEDLKNNWSKGDFTAITMARDWFKKGLKNPDLDPEIRKKVKSKIMPDIEKFLQRAKNVSRGK